MQIQDSISIPTRNLFCVKTIFLYNEPRERTQISSKLVNSGSRYKRFREYRCGVKFRVVRTPLLLLRARCLPAFSKHDSPLCPFAAKNLCPHPMMMMAAVYWFLISLHPVSLSLSFSRINNYRPISRPSFLPLRKQFYFRQTRAGHGYGDEWGSQWPRRTDQTEMARVS